MPYREAVFRIRVDPYSNRRLDPDPYSIYLRIRIQHVKFSYKNLPFVQIFHDFCLIELIIPYKNYLLNKIL